ncbi:MAG: metallophosphoesterase family protein [Candidatus Omnitrophica bacterium]|nr:metallophosphoesterase family protein [Candidatus Omnitrophota bacterium]
MRYGLFSDVHSNLEALQAVLTAMTKERVEKFFCLGDTIGYAANPNECLDLVRQLPAVAVAGNHDLAAVGHPILYELYDDAREAAEWTACHLTEENKNWIQGLPLVAQEEDATLVHGSLFEPEKFHYTDNPSKIEQNFSLMQTPFCFIGHSHFPWIIEETVGAGLKPAPTIVNQIIYRQGKKYLVNVGSVGQPRDGDVRASFCVWDSDRGRIELKRVEYDYKTTQRKILEAGLPARFAEKLETG